MTNKFTSISNRLFLEAAFKHMRPGEFAAVASFPEDPLEAPRWRWAPRYQWHHGMPVSGSIFGKPQNVYLAVSSFKPAADGTFHRRKADFGQLHMVMVDDVYEKVNRRKLKIPPSAMVQTSPASAQAFYFLASCAATRNCETSGATIDALVRSGLAADNADPGMRGVTRYGRLPIGINNKAKYVRALGHPFHCELTLWRPERRYTHAEFVKAFRLDVNVPANARRHGNNGYTPKPVKLRRGEALKRVNDFEAMLKSLADEGLYISSRGPWHEIVCPWVDEHTDGKPGGSALHVPAEGNAWLGGYRCWHGHCEGRTVGDVYRYAHALVRGAA